MEPMLFSMLIIMFWSPALLLLVAGLISIRLKRLRNILLILSLVCFSIPWLMVAGVRINGYIQVMKFKGSYIGIDKFSHEVHVEFGNDKSFRLTVDGCEVANDEGHWQYDREMDYFWIYADNAQIELYQDFRGGMTLTSSIITDCTELKDIHLVKE